MLFGTKLDEENGEPVFSYLTFDSGKKILLSNEEAKEFKDYIKMIQKGVRLGIIKEHNY